MKIEHVAIWVQNLEVLKEFYTHYFGMECSNKYVNTDKEFSSYFLSFQTGARLEIMHRPDISMHLEQKGMTLGWTHLAISMGSQEKVDRLTELLRYDGYVIKGEPRTTGDGYYESVVLDPEGNQVEITT